MKNLSFAFMLVFSICCYAQKGKNTNPKIPDGVQVWTIDAQKATCEGATTMQCLLVKKQGEKDYNLFYETIEGFTFEEGNFYTLWVREELKTPPIPADATMYNYILVKIVSKKPVNSYSNSTSADNPKTKNEMTTKTTTLIVNEEKGQCEGNPDAKCLLLKKAGDKEFEVFYQGIKDFVFEEGIRQTILVNERDVDNPMVKQAEPIYTLVKVLKKELIFEAKKETPVITETPKTILDKKWILRMMKDTDTSRYDIEDDAVWLELNSTNSKLNGKAPCNSFFGAFTSDYISTFQAMAVGSTRMYCENMKFEEMYFTLLQNADTFVIEKNKLVLYKGKRLLLIFE